MAVRKGFLTVINFLVIEFLIGDGVIRRRMCSIVSKVGLII